jgi:polysaccharide export outer membrane protein
MQAMVNGNFKQRLDLRMRSMGDMPSRAVTEPPRQTAAAHGLPISEKSRNCCSKCVLLGFSAIYALSTSAPGLRAADVKGQVPISSEAAPTPGYRIGAGDVLQISVWKETEVSAPSVVVRPDGRIAIPLIKEVNAAGLTTDELERVLVDKLALFVKDPNVTILVKEIRSKKVYLVGAVQKTGPIAMDYEMSVLQALSEAGGLTVFAKSKHIYILRAEKGTEERIPFNYDAVIKGKHMEQNVVLRPGDTVVVPN